MPETQFINLFVNYCYAAMFGGYVFSCWRWSTDKKMWPIPVVLLVTFVVQILMAYWAVEYRNNAVISHIFNPIQFILILYFLHQHIENPIVKKWLYGVGAGMLLYSVLNSIFIQNLKVFPSNFLVIANLLLIMAATVLFLEKLDAPSSIKLFKDPVFIIGSAILLFNAFSFLFFLLTNYLQSKDYSTRNIYKILLFANFLYYNLLLIASIISNKTTHTPSENS